MSVSIASREISTGVALCGDVVIVGVADLALDFSSHAHAVAGLYSSGA